MRKLKGPRPDPNEARRTSVINKSAKDLTKYLREHKVDRSVMPRKLAAILQKKRLDAMDLFASLDDDKNDSITYSELVDKLGSYGIHTVKYEVDELFEALDVDRSGSISFDEFHLAMIKATRENDKKGAPGMKGDEEDFDDQQRRERAEDIAQSKRNMAKK